MYCKQGIIRRSKVLQGGASIVRRSKLLPEEVSIARRSEWYKYSKEESQGKGKDRYCDGEQGASGARSPSCS